MYTFQDFRTEEINKGKSTYTKGTAVYTDPRYGQKEKTVLSFSNPAVFAALQKMSPGQQFDVDTVKDGQFTNWTAVKLVDTTGTSAPTLNKSAPPTTQVRSSYETPEERAARQVLIVKQSSLSAAVATLSPGSKGPLDKLAVLPLAQEYVDWVMNVGFKGMAQAEPARSEE